MKDLHGKTKWWTCSVNFKLHKADKRDPNKADYSQNDVCFELLDKLLWFTLSKREASGQSFQSFTFCW